jgi:hypothetical protein
MRSRSERFRMRAVRALAAVPNEGLGRRFLPFGTPWAEIASESVSVQEPWAPSFGTPEHSERRRGMGTVPQSVDLERTGVDVEHAAVDLHRALWRTHAGELPVCAVVGNVRRADGRDDRKGTALVCGAKVVHLGLTAAAPAALGSCGRGLKIDVIGAAAAPLAHEVDLPVVRDVAAEGDRAGAEVLPDAGRADCDCAGREGGGTSMAVVARRTETAVWR